MQEMWVQSLGWEDFLEKEMATHSSILAWEIPWTEEPGGLQSMGLQNESDTTWQLNNMNINTIYWVFVDCKWVSLIAQVVKNPPAMQETPVRFLGRNDLQKR